MIELLLINRSKERVPRQFLTKLFQNITKELKKRRIKVPKSGQLVLVFLDAAPARKLNKEYRGRDYATDVLSFEDGEGLGELVLCPSVLKRQAKEHDLTLREEMGYMVLHGFLHLLGYDHEESESEARRMFELQDEIFEKLR